MQRLFLSEVIAHEYLLKGKKNIYPIEPLQRCKGCGKLNHFKKHGFYDRYYTCGRFTERISIRRYICSSKGCNHTISMLPNFCHPRFIVGIEEIFTYLTAYFRRKGSVKEMLSEINKITNIDMSRQLLRFYKNRFIENLKYIESTFRLVDSNSLLSNEYDKLNEKAKKVLNTVKSWSGQINILSQRFHEETLTTFLCKQIFN